MSRYYFLPSNRVPSLILIEYADCQWSLEEAVVERMQEYARRSFLRGMQDRVRETIHRQDTEVCGGENDGQDCESAFGPTRRGPHGNKWGRNKRKWTLISHSSQSGYLPLQETQLELWTTCINSTCGPENPSSKLIAELDIKALFTSCGNGQLRKTFGSPTSNRPTGEREILALYAKTS